jgi:hypothetical protein
MSPDFTLLPNQKKQVHQASYPQEKKPRTMLVYVSLQEQTDEWPESNKSRQKGNIWVQKLIFPFRMKIVKFSNIPFLTLPNQGMRADHPSRA